MNILHFISIKARHVKRYKDSLYKLQCFTRISSPEKYCNCTVVKLQ